MTDGVDTFEAFAHAALPAFDLDPGATITMLNVSENGTFAVDDPVAGRSVLRVHRTNYHSEQAIRSELAWIEAIRGDGVLNTPAFLPARDGSPVVTARVGSEERFVVRFDWVDGVHPEEDRLVRDFVQLGAITARLHEHARHWPRSQDFRRFVWNFDTAFGNQPLWGRWQDGLGVGAEETEVLGRLEQVLERRLAAYGNGNDRFGLIHADMRLANLLVKGEEVTVIDFDDCGFSWYLYDLGSALSFIEHEPYVPDLIDSWVSGYRTVAALSAEEEAEIPTFVMFRRLLLTAWVGSHAETETGQELGEEFAAVSCRLAEDYLRDHG